MIEKSKAVRKVIGASVVVSLVALAITISGMSSVYGQEVRGSLLVDIPAGAYQTGAEHYVPRNIAIPVGTTVVWFNDDPNQPHTVTSGTPGSAESGSDFDSGIISEGAFFQHTFPDEGEFQYYCTIHPGMIGSVYVGGAVWEGHHFNVGLGAGAAFDFTEHERSLLHIEPTSLDIPEDEPVTYELTIMKNGEEVFSDEFRTLGGHLYVELIPTDGETKISGPDISDPIIGAYHIEGSFLKDNAAYTIRPEITLLFDQPPENEIADEFGMQIVPEFPIGVGVLAMLVGISAFVVLSKRSRLFGAKW
jgi:plastocyanin